MEEFGEASLKVEWQGPGVDRSVIDAGVATGAVFGGARSRSARGIFCSAGTEALSAIDWNAAPDRVEAWSSVNKNFGTGAIFSGWSFGQRRHSGIG